MEPVVQFILAITGSMFPFRKFLRSVSLPNLEDHDEEERGGPKTTGWLRQVANRISRSLTRVDDRSNSAAPLRRQPHPFAMQALGMRFTYNPRAHRLPEWPPPDPPPLTPLYTGPGRTQPNPNSGTPWLTRPWWRRNIPARPVGPFIHVTIETTDAIDPIPLELVERFRWTSTVEENDQEPMTLAAEEHAAAPVGSLVDAESGAQASTASPVGTSRAQLLIHPAGLEDMAVEHSATVQIPVEEELSGQTAFPIEHLGLLSMHSDQQEEGPVFQIYFVVVDSNPAVQREFVAVDSESNLILATTGRIEQRGYGQIAPNREEHHTEEENSNNIGLL